MIRNSGRSLAGLLLLALASASAWAQTTSGPAPAGTSKDKSADLFLNMEAADLGGTGARTGEKKAFLNTMEMEKSRLTRRMLKDVYDNAYQLYRDGNFEGARELTATILAIDPTFEEAAVLQRASQQLDGSESPGLSERQLAQQKFEEGLALYKDGRVVEAANRWREVVALAPYNLKARDWLRRADDDIATEHFAKGQELYKQGRLREALDQFYAAFARDPHYPKLESVIASVEREYQDQEAQLRVQEALALYGKGDLKGTADLLKQALETSPGNAQAGNLYGQVRTELAGRQVQEARTLESQEDYPGAIEAWKQAGTYGYDPIDEEAQIARIKDQQKRDALRKQEEAKLAKKRKDEQAAEKKKKAKEDKEESSESAGGESAGESKGLGINATPSIQGIGGPAATSGSGAGGGSGSGSGSAAPAAPAAPAVHVPTEQDKQNAVTHYQNAVIFFQENKLDQAYNEVTLALQLDPSNADADSLKQRIEAARNP